MEAKMSVLGLIVSYSPYLRSATVQFPLHTRDDKCTNDANTMMVLKRVMTMKMVMTKLLTIVRNMGMMMTRIQMLIITAL